MATGGVGESVDSRVVCSVCLEPYRGRHPKLLPCFHTFCLPCLSQLAHTDVQAASDDLSFAEGGGDETRTALTSTITCPTCRTVTPVPPGGVIHFQSNFYVDDGSSTTPEPKLPAASSSTTMATEQDVAEEDELQKKVNDQVKVVEKVLAKLGEEEEELARQRQAMDQEIQTRYAAGLRHLADARDECLFSLKDAAQAVQDKIETEKMVAQMLLSNLSHTREEGQRISTSPATAQSGLLTDAAFRHYQQLAVKSEEKAFFSYSSDDSITQALCDTFKQFMGTVAAFGQASPLAVTTSKPPEGVEADYVELLSSANLRHDVTRLQQDMARLQAENARLQETISATQRENLGTKTAVEKEMRSLQDALSSLQEKFVLQSQLEPSQKSLSALQQELGTLQKSLATSRPQVAFHAKMEGNGGVTAQTKEPLVLSEIITNVGGGYDPKTGIFTVPLSGLYIFLCSANALQEGRSTRFTISVDGKDLGLARSKDWISCSGFAAVKVSASQQVWMQTSAPTFQDKFTYNGEGFTYFTGILIQSDL